MIKSIFRLTMALAVLFIFSCNEDDDTGSPASYAIFGEREVSPETTGTYSLHVDGVEATWTSSDPSIMSIISTSGSTVEVAFLKSGTVRLMATDGVRSGVVEITVANGNTGITVTYAGTGSLKSGTSDTVFFSFDAPLAEVSGVIINEDTSGFYKDPEGEPIDAFVSPGASLSAMSSYKGSDEVFYAIYTAGSGDGQPEGFIESFTLNDTYGGVVKEYTHIKLPVVDNTTPYAKVVFSDDVVNDSSVVTITVTFSEAVMPDNADSILIYVSGAGVLEASYPLKATTTTDQKVWTLEYTTNGNGNGTMTANVDPGTVTDLAGNTAYIRSATLEIDNIAPFPALTNAFTVDVTGSVLTVTLSGEDEVRWMYLEGGATAPEAGDFDEAFTEGDVFLLAAGIYDFYYIAIDEAGNVSDVESEVGIVVPNP